MLENFHANVLKGHGEIMLMLQIDSGFVILSAASTSTNGVTITEAFLLERNTKG